MIMFHKVALFCGPADLRQLLLHRHLRPGVVRQAGRHEPALLFRGKSSASVYLEQNRVASSGPSPRERSRFLSPRLLKGMRLARLGGLANAA